MPYWLERSKIYSDQVPCDASIVSHEHGRVEEVCLDLYALKSCFHFKTVRVKDSGLDFWIIYLWVMLIIDVLPLLVESSPG